MTNTLTLADLTPGQRAAIESLTAPPRQSRRLLELGFCPGCPVECLQAAPWGDPVAYGVCGAVIALRLADARQIRIHREGSP